MGQGMGASNISASAGPQRARCAARSGGTRQVRQAGITSLQSCAAFQPTAAARTIPSSEGGAIPHTMPSRDECAAARTAPSPDEGDASHTYEGAASILSQEQGQDFFLVRMNGRCGEPTAPTGRTEPRVVALR